MPAPGPKDGHASRASRDLGGRRGAHREIKNVGVKSNGFKGASGAASLAGARPGEGGSARSIAARRRLRARFLAGEAGRAAKTARTVGRKRAREDARATTEDATTEDAKATTTTTTDAGRAEDDVAEAKASDAHVAGSENGYFCDVCACKCGSRNNYETHAASKRHRQNRDAARGREILAALKRQRAEISGEE